MQKKIHQLSSIFTAEASAILEAIIYCNLNNYQGTQAIVTDSLSTLEELCALSLRKSEIVRKIHQLIQKNTIIIWVPSHMGVVGNDYADNCISEGDYKSTVKTNLHIKLQQLWNTIMQNKYQMIHSSIEYENAWDLKRRDLMVLNRLRAGHSFLTHSHLCSKEPIERCQHCGETITIEHLFECEVNWNKSYKSNKELISWKEDLFIREKFSHIKQFLKSNDVYNLI